MTTIELTTAEVTAWADVPEGGTFWLVREASYDLRCPTCGGSASLPFEMTCADHRPVRTPPAEFVQACAPCEVCTGTRHLHPAVSGDLHPMPCQVCRIELVRPCPNCRGTGRTEGGLCASCDGRSTVTLGYAYAVGQPLPIVRLSLDHGNIGCIAVDPASGTVWAGGKIITAALAHYGPPESLVGKWAVELRRA